MLSRRTLLSGSLAAALAASPLRAAVRFDARAGGFELAGKGGNIPLFVDDGDFPGVLRAARDLAADIGRVTGADAKLSATPDRPRMVLIGTLGKSPVIDRLAQTGAIDVAPIRGKWESYTLQTVRNPMPGVREALVIAGSDKRGTIYGIYDLSQNIGVSPWYWWADVPVVKRQSLRLSYGRYFQGEPAVRYRGIFLNNEAPCLSAWTAEKFGGMNSAFYTKVFELLLRLRANYLWPAMWNNAFNEDDPKNGPLADEYGIVMGTSHHEPMNRAHREWTSRRPGNGEWNYLTNRPAVQQFFREGARRSKDRELLVTMGMRGDGDVALQGTGGIRSDVELLETIITDQRRILQEETGKRIEDIPQVWVLFTEVQKYYDAGLKLPEDVTLMFSDDNVGYIRRLPTPQERATRTGGFGVYHHMDMNGGPYSYKWINTNPFPKIWEQMNLALEYGADRIWISNIGDLKPLELPIEFFLAMAWDPKAVSKDRIAEWTRLWAEREFGPAHAAEIASLVSRYAKYNAWRKPEQLRPDTYSLENFREAERIVALWQALRTRAEAINEALPETCRAAYYQLVLHPIRGCCNLTEMLVAAARNKRFAQQGRASTNDEAAEVKRLFAQAHQIRDTYNHDLSGGKWNHLMDQSYIGYFDWYQPNQDIAPPVSQLDLKDGASFGVAIEGATQAWPGYYQPPILPPFDSLRRQRSWVEVFPRGTRPVAARVSASDPWIVLTETAAFSTGKGDRRYWVDIDWSKVPEGRSRGSIRISDGTVNVSDGVVSPSISVSVNVVKASAAQARAAKGRWGSLTGAFSIPAHGFERNVPAGDVRWDRIPDYGRVDAAMSIFPVDAPSIADPAKAPRLDYPIFVGEAGDWTFDLVTAPTLNVNPAHRLSLALWIDDEKPQIVTVFTPEKRESEEFLGAAHGQDSRTDMRIMRFRLPIAEPGNHSLHVAMVDPTIVVETIIAYRDKLPASYFGPPAVRIGEASA
ncbi:glycosyl hydrolase 115 family protein [Sphingobium sp. Sx8-8]|uniref:glycosyl hydrolase 115 family protein n=1 Tax=Sphingobium sp. Sx8-8 TaxID=2933617 RepID=UPI001F595D30|nr:glycosyl hydrolase 115 family protein [Sphingobium sp. Sx8-8]